MLRYSDIGCVTYCGERLKEVGQILIDYAYSNDQSPRGIDGIVLTKFDTIDDKVCI